jgi:hypothetical protein
MHNLAQWRFLRQVRGGVYKQMETDGFALIAADLGAAGVAVPAMGVLDAAAIDRMWAKAESTGELSDDVILDYGASPLVGAPLRGEGGFLGLLKRIIDWISDPANREKILAVIKFVMMLLAMFGI